MHSPDEPLNGATAMPDDRHALQRAVQARNLYHEGQRLIARAAALAAELAVSVPPGSLSEAFDQDRKSTRLNSSH